MLSADICSARQAQELSPVHSTSVHEESLGIWRELYSPRPNRSGG